MNGKTTGSDADVARLLTTEYREAQYPCPMLHTNGEEELWKRDCLMCGSRTAC